MGGAGAGPADVFWANRDQHAEPGRDHVQTLAAVFAHLDHLAAAAGTQGAVGLDDLLDPLQMRRQMTLVPFGRMGTFLPVPESPLSRFAGCGQHPFGDLDILEGQMLLVRVRLFGFGAELVNRRPILALTQFL